jgi:integrase
MPLKLVDPRPGKSPNYTIRGTHYGVRVNQTAGTPVRAKARAILKRVEAEIERGAFSIPGEPTFADAAMSYIDAGGEERFLRPLALHFGEAPLRRIDQAAVDEAAIALYPNASPATRNRQVYTPVMAILHRAGLAPRVRRPKGALGTPRTAWLHPEDFARLEAAARAVDPELAVLFTFLAYTGLRLSEALRIQVSDVRLADEFAYCGKTKNGEPRAVYLPPVVVAALANHPQGLDRVGKLFRYVKNKWLYGRAERAYTAAGIDHKGAPFHILRHSFGAMMTRVGADLVATGAWKSPAAARVYQHFAPTEEARKAANLPVWKERGKAAKHE